VVDTLGKIGLLIMRTPAEQMVTELEQAATKIQKIFKGQKARTEVKDKKEEGEKTPGSGVKKTKTGPAQAKDEVGQGVPKMVALFKALDSSGDGQLQIDEFADGLSKIPGINTIMVDGKPLDKQSILLLAQAIDASGNGTINYLEFLSAFEVNETSGSGIVDSVAEDVTTVLFRHRVAIRMGCHYLDEDGTGKIRSEDFQSILEGVNSALSRTEKALQPSQISLLVEAMTIEDDADGERIIDYNSFLRSFVIIDTANDRAVVKKWNNETC